MDKLGMHSKNLITTLISEVVGSNFDFITSNTDKIWPSLFPFDIIIYDMSLLQRVFLY